MEMHDAMQIYWSRFANKAQWALWVLLAGLHESGTNLGGIMFDDIGPNHRQGTAIFEKAFISVPPATDPVPQAWVQRMRFWTAVHESGHAFNLAHSWQKSLGTPWIPLVDEPEARSFMNYPYAVSGGEKNFFADFAYRFSDNELLFMRHAPERFVQMGNAAWFDHHGFREANVSPQPTFMLELKTRRDSPMYEFLEPVMLELKLQNLSSQVQAVPDNRLRDRERLTVVVKREGQPARELLAAPGPLLHAGHNRTLAPGEAICSPLFAAFGRNGWDIAEPGVYLVQVALHLEEEDLVSNPIRLRVSAPTSNKADLIAQDFFNDDEGRLLSFDGSRSLLFASAMNILRRVVDECSAQRVACHARVAVGSALLREYKELVLPDEIREELVPAASMGATINIRKPEPEEARKELTAALTGTKAISASEAAETLGHIEYREYSDWLCDWLHETGDTEQAKDLQERMLGTLRDHGLTNQTIIDDITHTRSRYVKKRGAAA